MLRVINFVALLLIVAIGSSIFQEQQRRPCRYLMSEGYVGWVRIDYKVADAPPLPIEDGHYLFRFPSSGRLETSSDMEYGWATDEYYYYSGVERKKLELSGDDSRNMIWGDFNGHRERGVMDSDERELISTYQYFFIGTKEDYGKYGQEKDEDYNPRIGNVLRKGNKD